MTGLCPKHDIIRLEPRILTSGYTEQDTESYYDSQDSIYSSFWDPDGSVHWGYSHEHTGTDFLAACANLNRLMIDKSQIDAGSRVLDLGCGNGRTALILHDELGCDVVGVDLSGVRINNALDALASRGPEVRNKVTFRKASAVDLPFANDSFSHVWSQATLYHVHDQATALREAYHVLEDGGVFVFDDLFKPQPNIGPSARKHVYERLLFDTEFSFESYQAELRDVGFTVLDAIDLSDHLKMSYWCVAIMTHNRGGEQADHYAELSKSYELSAQAVVDREVGWGLFLCQK